MGIEYLKLETVPAPDIVTQHLLNMWLSYLD